MDKQANNDENNHASRRQTGQPEPPAHPDQTEGTGQPGKAGHLAQQPTNTQRGRLFTREELAGYDGKEGRPAYVAYGGLVFDVSGSMRWRGGRHQDRHDAGRDLTAEFKEAPHSTTILLRVPIVGRLAR